MSIKILDLFGSPINLYIDGRKQIKTNIGGLFSITLIILLLVFAWLVGNDIIYKAKPFSYQQTNVLGKYSSITLNTTSFPLAFSLQDYNGQAIKTDTYFEYGLQTVALQADENGILQQVGSTSYELRNCNYSDFPLMGEDIFNSLGINNFLCPDKWNASIYGYWTESELIYLQFNVQMCDFVNNSTCKSKTEIENYISINQLNMNIYMFTPQVVIGNYTNPLSRIAVNYFTYLTPNTNKNIQNFISNDDVLTDDGFFSEALHDLLFLTVKNRIIDSMIFDSTVNCLMQFEFYSYNTSTQTYRKYIKVTEILASVGGILKVLFIIYQFLNTRFADIESSLIILKNLKLPENKCNYKLADSKNILNISKENQEGIDIRNIVNANKKEKQINLENDFKDYSEKSMIHKSFNEIETKPAQILIFDKLKKYGEKAKNTKLEVNKSPLSPFENNRTEFKGRQLEELARSWGDKNINIMQKDNIVIELSLTFAEKLTIVLCHKTMCFKKNKNTSIQKYLDREQEVKFNCDLLNLLETINNRKI